LEEVIMRPEIIIDGRLAENLGIVLCHAIQQQRFINGLFFTDLTSEYPWPTEDAVKAVSKECEKELRGILVRLAENAKFKELFEEGDLSRACMGHEEES
jgi:hypothetical protein